MDSEFVHYQPEMEERDLWELPESQARLQGQVINLEKINAELQDDLKCVIGERDSLRQRDEENKEKIQLLLAKNEKLANKDAIISRQNHTISELSKEIQQAKELETSLEEENDRLIGQLDF